MPTLTRYRATFPDGTDAISIWTERPLTHCWRWAGKDGHGRIVSGSGFAGSEELARKHIKSATSWLTRRPRLSKYEIDDVWKPGGLVVSEEVVLTEVIEVKAVKHPPHHLVRSVSPAEILQSWNIDAQLRAGLQRFASAASTSDIWEGLTEQQQRALVSAAGERHTPDVSELFKLRFSKKD